MGKKDKYNYRYMTLTIFGVISALLASTYVYYVIDSPSNVQTSNDWVDKNCVDKSKYQIDHLKLALMYSPGFCAARRPPILCHSRPKPLFSIHGLWPEMKGIYAYPNKVKCCTTHRDEDFRRHEWEDHGICGYGVDGIGDPHSYVSTALEIQNRYDLESVLARKGITPSSTRMYQASELYSAFKDGLGYDVELSCFGKRGNSFSFLVEVRICLDPTKPFALRNCPRGRAACFGNVSLPPARY